MLTSRRLSSHSPASARQRLASRDLQFADAKVHCSVARHCWTSTKYTHCDAASSRSFSLHMFCHFAFVRTKLHSDLMTILAPAPQPPAPSPQPPQGTRPFGRMNMPFLLLSFFDDIRVARVCIRVRGPYLVCQMRSQRFTAQGILQAVRDDHAPLFITPRSPLIRFFPGGYPTFSTFQ